MGSKRGMMIVGRGNKCLRGFSGYKMYEVICGSGEGKV